MPGTPIPRGRRAGIRLTAALLLTASSLAVPAAPAAAARDVTSDVLAGRDVVLDGDAVIRVPSGKHSYGGTFSGTGTITFAGSGTLVLTRDSDITIPAARRGQRLVRKGGNWPWWQVADPDPPAVVIRRGVRVEYGAGGAGFIGHYPWTTPGVTLNALNVRVDGTLVLPTDRRRHLGVISGSGMVIQPRNTWPGLDLAGDHPFSGVLYNGTGVAYGATTFSTSMPNVRTVLNQGSFILDTPMNGRTVARMDFWNREWGSDVNVHSRGTGLVVLTGVYSWADGGPDTAPTLSDPALNLEPRAHRANGRGLNIEGAHVQFGDGTTHRFFLPGSPRTAYINVHAARLRSLLRFDYDGPVTVGTTISGGRYADTLAAPGQGDVVIVGTRGNEVTFAAPQNYDGSTTIEKGAVLRLGSGAAGGDASMLTSGSRYGIVVDGTLVAANHGTALVLSRISGRGGVTQDGPARLTVTGRVGWTGPTEVSGGTLAVRGGSLAGTSTVRLTGRTARLDLSAAADAVVPALRVADGGRVLPGGHPLTVRGKLTGAGRIRGDLRTRGAVAPHGVLTVDGGWTQTRSASLRVSAPGDAVEVSGPVALAGRLQVDPAAVVPGTTQVVLVRQGGDGAVSGTFDGLAEGAALTVGDAGYRVTYRGGDGNDVALTVDPDAPGATASPGPVADAATAGGAAGAAGGGAGGRSGPRTVLLAGAAVGLVGGAVAAGWLVLGRRRTRRAGDDAGPGTATG